MVADTTAESLKRKGEDMERSFVMLKPDAVKKGHSDTIIQRLKDAGLTIKAKKELTATKDMVLEHYADAEDWLRSVGEKTLASYKKMGLDPSKAFASIEPKEIGRTVREWLSEYITSGPVVAMIVEGAEGTIQKIRDLAGKTNPADAEPGTIRGDLSDDSYEKANNSGRALHNLIHASESPSEAEREISIWFPNE